jgi:hypothetical protein
MLAETPLSLAGLSSSCKIAKIQNSKISPLINTDSTVRKWPSIKTVSLEERGL